MAFCPVSRALQAAPGCDYGSQGGQSSPRFGKTQFVGVGLWRFLNHSTGAPEGGTAYPRRAEIVHLRLLWTTSLPLNLYLSIRIFRVCKGILGGLGKAQGLAGKLLVPARCGG